ncbi:CRISPR-associated helicase/endonuclease Cas3 [Actinomadura oligospora]|uniref:CRISPR-associated helicase/endonuclease Cas3 n=1 Tax=Actinomadura oligospora TaxID=111804 RepID=UPI0004B6466D|nr:CRISPR-associated helicase/endonuclease Cas3 [Actinomadura oligospora]
MELSAAARAAWGKTGEASRKRSIPAEAWHPLVSHLIDTGNVARWLWREFLPTPFKAQLSDAMPGGAADAERLMCWLAALHDLGKASDFQSKSSLHARLGRRAGLPFSERTQTPHSLVSASALWQLLNAMSWDDPDWPALVLGGHHGAFPGLLWQSVARRALTFEHPGWGPIRGELFEAVTDHFGVKPETWRQVRPAVPLQLCITGAVILADWLASNEELYSYQEPFSRDYPQESAATTTRIRDLIGFRDVWRPDQALAPATAPVFFAARWPAIATPRDVQVKALREAQQATGAGLMIIEAPMGEGKTEAALAAAEVLAVRAGSQGVFVGLPTQATSNQMFTRVGEWLGTQGAQTTVTLAHGKARRQQEYRQLFLPRGVGIDECDGGIVASQWLSGGKKRLLTPVVVGTVDQVLLAGVAARHVALRVLGLVGKVMVVDEVHAYDAYMSVILRRVLSWLGALNVPVVLLSATLPRGVRQELLDAYAGDEVTAADGRTSYPQISWVGRGSSQVRSVPARAESGSPVRLGFVNEPGASPDDVVNTVCGLLTDGGCALVIRNTVGRAQRTWRAFVDKLGSDNVSLAHSRFTTADRRDRDRKLISDFGPKRKRRPSPHVVVATQVAEQSLDVDFDVGVSDLAPVDLLLQRLGRVHRHERKDRRRGLSEPRLLVAGHSVVPDGPPRLPFGSVMVYGEHLLWRTAAALLGRDQINLPQDIPALIEQVYGAEPIGPDTWQWDLRRAADDQQDALDAMRLAARQVILPPPDCGSLADIGNIGEARDEDSPEVQATVRLGPPTVEVILLRATTADGAPEFGLPVSAGDKTEIPLQRRPSEGAVDTILDQAIRLPQQLTNSALEQSFRVRAWSGNPWLSRVRVLLLPPEGPLRMGDRLVTYDSTIGLEDARA